MQHTPSVRQWPPPLLAPTMGESLSCSPLFIAALTHSTGTIGSPRLHQPLRSMAARRDELALEYLRLDAELKHVQDQRRDVAGRIDGECQSLAPPASLLTAQLAAATRAQTSSLIDEVRTRSHEREERRHRSLVSTAKRHEASRKLQEELQVVRGKREMVKGVLRVSNSQLRGEGVTTAHASRRASSWSRAWTGMAAESSVHWFSSSETTTWTHQTRSQISSPTRD